MSKLSYGLYVLTAREGNYDNGCIINTAVQAASIPDYISISVAKTNYTHDMLMKTNAFNVSIISQKADFNLFKHFGFQSGADTNKFENYKKYKRAENGIIYITNGVNAFISAEVKQIIALNSHTTFIGKVNEEKVLNNDFSATYEYYHKEIKPKPSNNKYFENKAVWRCKICGYEYSGNQLPEDFICPICKHSAVDFEKV